MTQAQDDLDTAEAKPDGGGKLVVVEVARRGIPEKTSLILFIRAGGRCQRRGCNARLFEHRLSKEPGNFADRAHIVAFSETGPRGEEGSRPLDINNVDNLMALCKPCHKEIDDYPARFPRDLLEEMKREHEVRVDTVLDLAPELRSHIITFSAPIRGFRVAIPRGDAFHAMQPRHPVNGHVTDIDLRGLTGLGEDEEFLSIGRKRIDTSLAVSFGSGGPVEEAGHLSVFAIGPIALLAYLGARLGDKVAADLYQRHRDTEDWAWKSEADYALISYGFERAVDHGDGAPAAVILSLSGKIDPATLPEEISGSHTLYEITLDGWAPSPTFLNCKRDLIAFRKIWHDAQSAIAAAHGDVHPLPVFPAVPAPVAVALGKDRLPKARAPLHLYDNDFAKGGFKFQLEIS